MKTCGVGEQHVVPQGEEINRLKETDNLLIQQNLIVGKLHATDLHYSFDFS